MKPRPYPPSLGMLHGFLCFARVKPTVDDIVCQLGDEPRPLAARRQSPSEWFAELEEHLPHAFAYCHAADLDELRVCQGCTPREAAAYARAFLCAPPLQTADDAEKWPDKALPAV